MRKFGYPVIFGLGGVLVLPLSACSPPDDKTLASCQEAAREQTHGQPGFTDTDIGELTEACMTERGYNLIRTGKDCSHNLSSQQNKRCYVPNTLPGRIYAKLPSL